MERQSPCQAMAGAQPLCAGRGHGGCCCQVHPARSSGLSLGGADTPSGMLQVENCVQTHRMLQRDVEFPRRALLSRESCSGRISLVLSAGIAAGWHHTIEFPGMEMLGYSAELVSMAFGKDWNEARLVREIFAFFFPLREDRQREISS